MRDVPWWLGLVGLLFLALALAGCDDSGVLVGDDDDMAPTGCGEEVEAALAVLGHWQAVVSCGAMFMGTAPDAAQTIALTLQLDLHDERFEEGATYAVVLDGDEGSLAVETGENLLHYDCNDALWLEEIVERHWYAVEGTATLEIIEAHDEWDVLGRLTLSGVEVEDPENPGSGCPVPDTTWDSLHIGWLPG